MIKKYKTISIVYGGSGADYASKMNNLISNLSNEKKIPIKPVICLENIITGDMLGGVVNLFRETDVCITFLTADDFVNGKKRVRQNVIFELGMALFQLGKDKVILLADFDPKDPGVELPSDINGLEIRRFNKDNEDEVFAYALDKILNLSESIKSKNGSKIDYLSYGDLLTRQTYYVDYEHLFAYQNSNIDLNQVLEDWYQECKSLNRYEERAIYFIERVGFLPIFGVRDGIYEWYKKMETILTNYHEKDIEESSAKLLKFAKNTIIGLITYVCYSFKQEEKSLQVYKEIISFLNEEPLPKGGNINPLLATVYLDYLGLSYMHAYEFNNEVEYLDKAIELFTLIVDRYVDQIDTSLSVWAGFLYFNLGRAHVKKYRLNQDNENKEKALMYFKKAKRIRKDWIVKTCFANNIRNALSVEYFMAAIEQIDFSELSGEIDHQKALEEFNKLNEELSSYYSSDDKLEKLSIIQTKINGKINSHQDIKFNY